MSKVDFSIPLPKNFIANYSKRAFEGSMAKKTISRETRGHFDMLFRVARRGKYKKPVR